MKKLIIGALLTLLTTTALAENLINTETKTWKSRDGSKKSILVNT